MSVSDADRKMLTGRILKFAHDQYHRPSSRTAEEMVFKPMLLAGATAGDINSNLPNGYRLPTRDTLLQLCDIVLKETGVLRASPEIINYVAGIKADLQRTLTPALSDDESVDTVDQDITSPPIGPLGKDLAHIIQRAERVSASCDTPTIGKNLSFIARAFRAAIYSANVSVRSGSPTATGFLDLC